MLRYGLTTFDNPFSPLSEFDKWFEFDLERGYNTCEYLGRIAKPSDGLTDEENEDEVQRAIDEIIKLDPFNRYKKVAENVK